MGRFWMIGVVGTVATTACGSPRPQPSIAMGFEGLGIAAKVVRLDSVGPGAAGDPETHRAIAILLHDSAKTVGFRAAYWMAQVGRRSLPSLTEALGDPKPVTQAAAAYGLGALGPAAKGTVPRLIEVLASPDDSASAMADWAIGVIEPRPRRLAAAIRALRWGPRHQWLDHLEAVGQLGPQAAPLIPFLIRTLGDADEVVAGAAAAALVRIGVAAQLPVERAVMEGSPVVRARASRLVAVLKPGL